MLIMSRAARIRTGSSHFVRDPLESLLFISGGDSEGGAARIRTGVQWFFCFPVIAAKLTQTISDSNPKATLVYLYQATLQPHGFIYKGFGNFANLQIFETPEILNFRMVSVNNP